MKFKTKKPEQLVK